MNYSINIGRCLHSEVNGSHNLKCFVYRRNIKKIAMRDAGNLQNMQESYERHSNICAIFKQISRLSVFYKRLISTFIVIFI